MTPQGVVIVSRDGYVPTNHTNHRVVERATKLTVAIDDETRLDRQSRTHRS